MRSSPYKLRCILCCCPCCFGGIGRSLQEFSNSGAFWSFTFWYVRRSRRTVRLERADAPRSQDHLRRFWRLLCRARAGWLRQPRRQPHARAVSLSVAAHAGAAAPCPQCAILCFRSWERRDTASQPYSPLRTTPSRVVPAATIAGNRENAQRRNPQPRTPAAPAPRGVPRRIMCRPCLRRTEEPVAPKCRHPNLSIVQPLKLPDRCL